MFKEFWLLPMCVLFVVALCFPGCSGVIGLEPPEDAKISGEGIEAATLEDANIPGVATVYQMRARQTSETSARNSLESWARDHGLSLGWDPEKERLTTLEFAFFETGDPTNDRNFLGKRESEFQKAIVRAKVDIIRFIHSRMTASYQFEMPGTDVYRQLNDRYTGIRQRLETKRQEVLRLLEQVEWAETEALKGATARDRINALLDAAMQHLGAEFDSGRIAADKREQYERLKSEYQNVNAQYDALLKEAETIRNNWIAEWNRGIVREGQMQMAGATLLHQAESWDSNTRQYEVAVLLCWSPQLERAARAVLTDEPINFKGDVGMLSLRDWLDAQDLSVMVGPRSFIDNRGHRHFIGIATQPVRSNRAEDAINRQMADMSAQQMVVRSLSSGVYYSLKKSTTIADTGLQAEERRIENFEESIGYSDSHIAVSGLRLLLRTVTKHPLSGQDMHVSVWGASTRGISDTEVEQTD
jgi:hypothetical protein